MRSRYVLVLAGALTLIIPALGMTTASAASGPAPAVVAHPAAGCGEPLKVLSPQAGGAAGYARFARALGAPDGPGTLLGQAEQRHVRWLTSLACKPGRERHPVPPAARKSGRAGFNAEPSSNWSGYQDSLSSPPNYAQAFWTIPALGLPQPGDTDFSSVWPGIGDGNGGELIQAGSEQDITCPNVNNTCGTVETQYDFWFEVVPGEAEQVITNLVPAPGDSVAVSAFWSSQTGAEFGICDFTQQMCGTATQASSGPDSTAEWIVERPSVEATTNPTTCILPPLAAYGTVNLTSAGFNETPQGSLEDVLSQGNPAAIDMFDAQGTQLDSTSPVGSDGASFSDTYLASGQTSAPFSC